MAPVTQDIMVAPASKVNKHENNQTNKNATTKKRKTGKSPAGQPAMQWSVYEKMRAVILRTLFHRHHH